MPYQLNDKSGAHREAVENWLFGLDLVSPATRAKIVTAWVTTWTSGPFANGRVEDIPWGEVDIGFSLAAHVNEVTRIGLDLAQSSRREWGRELDNEIFVPILILHDVDKPLLFDRREGVVTTTPLYDELPHGVPGAMLLKELGFPLEVIHPVCTHSPAMPFHGRTHEAFLLHFADHISAEHAWARSGRRPMYFPRRPA